MSSTLHFKIIDDRPAPAPPLPPLPSVFVYLLWQWKCCEKIEWLLFVSLLLVLNSFYLKITVVVNRLILLLQKDLFVHFILSFHFLIAGRKYLAKFL